MTIRTGTSFQIERTPRELGGFIPIEAYLMLLSGTTYVFGSGDKAHEAAAFLKDAGSGVYTVDSDPTEEDRPFYQVSATGVMT